MTLAREHIDQDADKVVRRLARAGHQAYLVGGCVRDLLLKRTPKDFDVATSATPTEIKQLFRNCRIIGKRFRLAHIFFGGKIIETSTFRANPRDDGHAGQELLIRHDNVFGSDTEDAQRRDFTINGLFYDIGTEEVIDHVGGLHDLEEHVIRTIGDPDIRFREDPVRMLRAIKFAARLDFGFEANTYAALLRQRGEIVKCAPPRVLEEFYRLLRGGAAHRSITLLVETGVAHIMSAQLARLLSGSPPPEAPDDTTVKQPSARRPAHSEEAEWAATWAEPDGITVSLRSRRADDRVGNTCGTHDVSGSQQSDAVDESLLNTANALEESASLGSNGARDTESVSHDVPAEISVEDQRELAWKMLDQLDRLVLSGGEASNALIIAALTNPFVADALLRPGLRPVEASMLILDVMQPMVDQLRMARRDAERARQILLAQRRLAPSRRRRGKPMALARRDYFDEALSIYEMTAETRGRDTKEIRRWRQLREDGDRPDDDSSPAKRRRRRRGGRRRRGESPRSLPLQPDDSTDFGSNGE